MAGLTTIRGFSWWRLAGLYVGIAMLWSGVSERSWGRALFGLAVLAAVVWRIVEDRRGADVSKPWPWPPDFRARAEALARPLDPTPKRILPPDEKSAAIAHVATTQDAVSQLITEKPPGWPWALFTSVLVMRRNAVGARLRSCVSGYQPRPRMAQLSGQAYLKTVGEVMTTCSDLLAQAEQFVLSPAFTGAFGSYDGSSADAEAIRAVADRLMDYYDAFLVEAERCLQTPVESDAVGFAQDMGALGLCPLLGFEQFILTMCERIGQAQDLLPYANGVVGLDDATLTIDLPDGLMDRINAQIKRFKS